MVNIHYPLSGSIFKPLEFRGKAIVLRKMACQAVFFLLFQGIGMHIMKKYHLWAQAGSTWRRRLCGCLYFAGLSCIAGVIILQVIVVGKAALRL